MDPETRSKVERLTSGDPAVLDEILAEVDSNGSIKAAIQKMADANGKSNMLNTLSDSEGVLKLIEKLAAENTGLSREPAD